MVEEYIKDLQTIEIEVKNAFKNINTTKKQKQTMMDTIQKHEIIWLTSLHTLEDRISEMMELQSQDENIATLIHKL